MESPDLKLLRSCYENAIKKFCEDDIQLLATITHEQAIAHRIAMYLEQACRAHPDAIDSRYVVDCEYNRNGYGIKQIINEQFAYIEIRADAILHSRGQILDQDNLIAIELKILRNASQEAPDSDRTRLKAMTTPITECEMKWGGGNLPAAVCGYKLGVYVLINSSIGRIDHEFFAEGAATGDLLKIDLREQVTHARIANMGVPGLVPRKRAR